MFSTHRGGVRYSMQERIMVRVPWRIALVTVHKVHGSREGKGGRKTGYTV